MNCPQDGPPEAGQRHAKTYHRQFARSFTWGSRYREAAAKRGRGARKGPWAGPFRASPTDRDPSRRGEAASRMVV